MDTYNITTLGLVTPSNVYKLLQKSKKGFEFSDEGISYIYQLIGEEAIPITKLIGDKKKQKELIQIEFNRTFADRMRKQMEAEYFDKFLEENNIKPDARNQEYINHSIYGKVSALTESVVYLFRIVGLQKFAKMKIEVTSQEAFKEIDYKLYVRLQAYMVLTGRRKCTYVIYNKFIDCMHAITIKQDPFLAKQIKERVNKAMHYVKKKKIK